MNIILRILIDIIVVFVIIGVFIILSKIMSMYPGQFLIATIIIPSIVLGFFAVDALLN